ncbi:hypothetical protein [Pseudalkalibacillus berkeleyi]|uniref:DUF5590 domain-containing protein n=1 Tax=Pseudalkalibacillus berkeleyi TaxID=1069813 RepID=A0ABS9H0L7_9BACL|nr:hypothetical protein [Pseudalkalibacillus berkeleyi]MCF6137546.1 hypothetical protein [Pseudalkalibacillus berkeleyi]
MKRILWLSGIFVLGTFILGISYYYYVWNEHGDEQNKSIAYAKNNYEISDVIEANHYYGSYGAFDVISSTVNGKKTFIFVPLDKKGESVSINAEDGWSKQKVSQYVQQELQPDHLISINLGLEKYKETSSFTPVWEIVYKNKGNQYTFHYIRFDDGTFFKTYKMKQS